MEIEWIRRHCMSHPHATEQIQWEDDLVFKVGGKMFAVLALEPSHGVCLSLKCTPEAFGELTELPGIRPAPYLARYSWVGLERLDALPADEIRALVDTSYKLVVDKLPKKVRDGLAKND